MLGDRLGSVFLHRDFGVACSYPGCPPVAKLWARSWIPDVSPADRGRGTVASVVGVWVPSLITNMVLVEYGFFLPGFLGETQRALAPGKLADVALVQGLALRGAVLIVAVSVLADVVLVTLDPCVR